MSCHFSAISHLPARLAVCFRVSAPPSGKGTDTSKLSPTSKHEVFLGGSCNPTTWRKDLAIPALSKAGVTYFNPQVDEWYPELIDIEEQAKTSAFLLLFVVDNKTRAISSMVEIAYLTGKTQCSSLDHY